MSKIRKTVSNKNNTHTSNTPHTNTLNLIHTHLPSYTHQSHTLIQSQHTHTTHDTAHLPRMLITARAANALSAVSGPFPGTYEYTRKVKRVISKEPDRVRTVLPGRKEGRKEGRIEGGREGGRRE